MKVRIEKDSLGIISVPAERLYGAQTARALANFGSVPPGYSLSARSSLIKSLIRIKKVAALTNHELGHLDLRRMRLIRRACDSILSWSDFSLEFPIHILHGGGGTSANMNVNEVIANHANSLAGKSRGAYSPIHPLDHVNLSQSTNDVYPSACRLTIAMETRRLLESLSLCIQELKNLETKHGKIRRVTRTCLQDAVSSTWGSFFSAEAQVLRRHLRRLSTALAGICILNLGGGVAGEPNSAPPRFARLMIRRLSSEVPELKIRKTNHFADSAQNCDDLVAFGQAIEGLCRTLVKQAADLRLLGSGPECGLMEVLLPARQPGSSAMPGKINPVIPEFLMQCCFSTIGFVHSCGLAAEHAELDLNIWEGVFLHSLCTSLDLLVSGLRSYAELCLADLDVNKETSIRNSNCGTSQITAYARLSSYSEALGHLVRSKQPDKEG